MKKAFKYSILAAGLALGASSLAHADPWKDGSWKDGPSKDHGPWKDKDHDLWMDPDRPWDPKPAPEVDPGMALAGFSLLGGTLTVLRARQRK